MTDSGFVFHDTVIPVGQHIRVGIEASGDGANITWFHIGWNNGESQTFLDSGLNHPVLRYEQSIIKTASALETWTYLVMDRNRNLTNIRLILRKSDSSHFGEITSFPEVLLGAQNSSSAGSFFSLSNGKSYFQDEAFEHQDSIDILYYYDIYNATLSSPNESDAPAIFTGPTGLANWTQKNETRYDTTSLTSTDFDLAQTDSLILAAYEPVNLKRKVKFVTPGMIISFKAPSGKIGLIKVMEITDSDTGYIRMSVKIQK
ncbi:MAG: hypothetical protein V1733_05260 [bacterium]